MKLLQSSTRALRALDFMAEQGSAVRLTDVADALQISKSNASHLLKTLIHAGYAEQDGNRQYRAAGKIQTSHQRTLEEIVTCQKTWHPALEELRVRTGECAHMGVLVKSNIWYIDKVDSAHQLKVDHPIGMLSPLHCTALGKTFLAFGSAKAENPLTTHTLKTITSRARLQEEIRLTQARGFAIDSEEFALGIRCVAGPIFDQRGSMIAAIGVSGPSVRVSNEQLVDLGRIVKEVSNRSLPPT
jgi:DNA-binding IclR family transcriptional regulator